MLGLYHSFEFTDDPVALEAGATKTPNFMSHDIAFKSTLGFVDFQKRLIHSYLGGGRVFQQYQQVNFDALSYLEMVKRYNGYKESPPIKTAKAGKISYRVKSDKIRTFDDDDEEDEDDGGLRSRGQGPKSRGQGSGVRGQGRAGVPARHMRCTGWKACATGRKQNVGRALPAVFSSRSQVALGNVLMAQAVLGQSQAWRQSGSQAQLGNQGID